MLSVERLAASYGPAQVLFDISFSVNAGEVVTLIGRNGMGKTTTIFALMGLLPPEGGTATFDGLSIAWAALELACLMTAGTIGFEHTIRFCSAWLVATGCGGDDTQSNPTTSSTSAGTGGSSSSSSSWGSSRLSQRQRL